MSEARLQKTPWKLADMEPNKRQAMLDAIPVVDVLVDRIEGQSKLNQHKVAADHIAVANVLAHAPGTPARELAAKMRAFRPHLAYDFSDATPQLHLIHGISRSPTAGAGEVPDGEAGPPRAAGQGGSGSTPAE
jgi:hypothetical protein